MFSMDDTEDKLHEEAGAKILERFFPSLVTDCVRLHVAAKRYLCAARPEYFERLSEASIHSLKLQGGPMTPEEVTTFEANPNADAIIKLRYLDDEGKIAGLKTPSPERCTLSSCQRLLQPLPTAHGTTQKRQSGSWLADPR